MGLDSLIQGFIFQENIKQRLFTAMASTIFILYAFGFNFKVAIALIHQHYYHYQFYHQLSLEIHHKAILSLYYQYCNNQKISIFAAI